MFRRSILPHARPTLLLIVFAIALPTQAARSQDLATQNRLDRLERDLSMLQRQVYRSVYRSAGGSLVPADSNTALDSEPRMDRLEAEIRELTGRVEDAVNGVEQLRRHLEQINSNIDMRFGQGQGPPSFLFPPHSGPILPSGTRKCSGVVLSSLVGAKGCATKSTQKDRYHPL